MDLNDKQEILSKTLYSYIGYNNVEIINDEISDSKEEIKSIEISESLDEWFINFNNNLENKKKKNIRKKGFLEMRKLQVIVLKDIFENIEEIHGVFTQSIRISQFIEKMSKEFNELNNVNDLLIELEELQVDFKSQKLPSTREEFENRAMLITISKNLKQFLGIKSTFIESKDYKLPAYNKSQ